MLLVSFLRCVVVMAGLLAVVSFFGAPATVSAQALEADPTLQQAVPPVETAAPSTRQPIKLHAVESRQLPAEMYGQWSVVATLMKTNLPGNHQSRVYDIWQLAETGQQVSLSNPNTGAFASITVDEVEGNTATFHHRVVLKPGRQFLMERPTVTVKGDRMVGTTTHTYIHTSRDGQVERVYHALFRIDAQRLAESRVEFGDTRGPAEFEIEEVRPGSVGTTPETVESVMFSN